ncbi:hypothetical protein [Methyloligella solikamskensis]|uniref:Uncharacterized protein n=1 Tax=Methyloligella solikamskensis TaxID=1177756 RepID=A0ABW3J7H7_9HYPH
MDDLHRWNLGLTFGFGSFRRRCLNLLLFWSAVLRLHSNRQQKQSG